MSTNTARGLAIEALNDASVAEYLQRVPDFFERNSQLLDKLRLPHVRAGGATVSLVERQVEVLRERNLALERKLRDLIEVARTNDLLADRIHRLCQRLIQTRTTLETVTAIETSLREDFEAMHAVIVVFLERSEELERGAGRFLRIAGRDSAEMKMFDSLFQSGKPRCGQIRDAQRDYLFGKDTVEIGSAALTPLGSKGSIGILAIGSSDAQRFSPGMSTEFLTRVGEVVSVALMR
jgi:uncharacterized protein YigA (DUF484 family)